MILTSGCYGWLSTFLHAFLIFRKVILIKQSIYFRLLTHSGPENLKKFGPKKIVETNKSIFIFCNFKNVQKSIFELGKSLKLPKMHEKKMDLFDFTNFLSRCGNVVPDRLIILPSSFLTQECSKIMKTVMTNQSQLVPPS